MCYMNKAVIDINKPSGPAVQPPLHHADIMICNTDDTLVADDALVTDDDVTVLSRQDVASVNCLNGH